MVTVIKALVGTCATMADGTLKIMIYGQETDAKTMTKIFEMSRKPCVVAISESEFNEKQIKALDKADVQIVNDKTPSQRLRGVIFRLWEQDHMGFNTADAHYAWYMEQLITEAKAKLINENG